MFSARVVQVFIASPSDLPEERDAIRSALADWNALNAETAGVVLLPRSWETHATPNLAVGAQGAINYDVLRQADLAVCCFWTRLGSPTSSYESGTVEEIERALQEGKQVLLYFSERPVVPGSVNPDQFAAVMKFKSSAHERGLCGSFDSPASLRALLSDDLTRATRALLPADRFALNSSSGSLAGLSGPSVGQTRDDLVQRAKRQFVPGIFETVARWESLTIETWATPGWTRLKDVWTDLSGAIGSLAARLGYDDPLVRHLQNELKWFRQELDGHLAQVTNYGFSGGDETDLTSLHGFVTDYISRARLVADLDWLMVK